MRKMIFFIIILIMAFAMGVLSTRNNNKSGSASQSQNEKKKVLYWVAPMNPSYRSDKPGKSPMGMELEPVYADGNADDTNSVKISAAVINNLGVRTQHVQVRDLSRIIDTVGYVTVDENKIEHVHTYVDGWIQKLDVKTTGEHVNKGDLLFELYSPTLNNAQEEFMLALKNNNLTLVNAGEKKLITLGMSQSQIDVLKKTKKPMKRIKVYAEKSGIISNLNIREGNFIKPDTDIMTIEDLSHIWVIAEVFERQAAWVKEGQGAIASLSYIPGKKWQGKVDYVYPELDAKTRTLRVRLTFPNPDLTFKPKMYANVKIFSKTIKAALSIPREALIRTGDGDRVIVFLGDGRFKAVPVNVGIESGDYYQVLSGLTKKDTVVTSAQFLIDSESNLRAGMSRMEEADNKKTNVAPQEFVGMGLVQSVNESNRMITIKHQPIPELGMGKMSMELAVEQSIDLSSIKAGDEIHFVLTGSTEKDFKIIKIHVVDKAKPKPKD